MNGIFQLFINGIRRSRNGINQLILIYIHFIFWALIEYFWLVNGPVNGFVGQLATRWPQVALPRRLPID